MDLIFNEDTKQFELAKQPYKTVEIRCVDAKPKKITTDELLK